MSNKETEQNPLNEEDLEEVGEILLDVIDTSAKIYSLLADEEITLLEVSAVIVLCSAMFLHESAIETNNDVKELQNKFFENVKQAYDLISDLDEKTTREPIQ